MHGYRVPPALSGRAYAAEPRRGGSGALPYGPFLAGDGRWFVLGITGQFWPKAAAVLGHSEWTADPRFATEADRQANEVELNRLVAEAMQGADADEWQRRFVGPASRRRSIREATTIRTSPATCWLASTTPSAAPRGRRQPLALGAPLSRLRPAPGPAPTPPPAHRIAGLSEAEAELARPRIARWPREARSTARAWSGPAAGKGRNCRNFGNRALAGLPFRKFSEASAPDGNVRGATMGSTHWAEEHREWHRLFDAACDRKGFFDNSELASLFCARAGRTRREDFEAAKAKLRGWRAGRRVPRRANFFILSELLQVDRDPDLLSAGAISGPRRARTDARARPGRARAPPGRPLALAGTATLAKSALPSPP